MQIKKTPRFETAPLPTYTVCKILPSLIIKSPNGTISLNWHKKIPFYFYALLKFGYGINFQRLHAGERLI